ncbi:MAG: VWA domain-containing protein [Betaproteobacteria bacterium]|nr:VWA domain-containing protein [Betaproteobacteria bacterium]
MSHLAQNILHFTRVLRTAGVACGPDRAANALRALNATGVADRNVVKSALSATLISRRDDAGIFDEAFELYWRDPDLAGKMRALLLPKVEGRARGEHTRRRLTAAFFPHAPSRQTQVEERVEFNAALTFSNEERLKRVDFESMTPEEFNAAKRLIARMRWNTAPLTSRRWEPSPGKGIVDWRASARAAIRQGGDAWPIKSRRAKRIDPPWVVLADISGSMEQGTRMMLHFIHAFARAQKGERAEAFLFGTRLTRITRLLAARDADAALDAISRAAPDWGGGTRIGPAMAEFNRQWSRRVLGQRARVLLITDGLDRDDGGVLSDEMARLKRSAREIVWLNPLLRYAAFEAKAQGPRAILPHVTRHLPVHDLAALETFAAALRHAPGTRTPVHLR